MEKLSNRQENYHEKNFSRMWKRYCKHQQWVVATKVKEYLQEHGVEVATTQTKLMERCPAKSKGSDFVGDRTVNSMVKPANVPVVKRHAYHPQESVLTKRWKKILNLLK